MSQRLNPTGRIAGPGPNAMQRGDYGPWNVARIRPSPVPCEQTIYREGGMLNNIHKISRQNPVELERSPTERVKRIPVTDRNR